MQRYRGRRKRVRRGSTESNYSVSTPANAGDPDAPKKGLDLPGRIGVKQLAVLMNTDPIDVIKQLIRNGVMANINQVIEFDLASTIATELGFETTQIPENAQTDSQETLTIKDDDPDNSVTRPPVVTILGHVDHGKTTLLDAMRQSNITDEEIGGITQRIGAYQVEYKGQKITFIDTPGHEAFTSMRSRGAKVTDIAVLVVAADDGVMPQTVEAMDHAKAAGIPIVVAINKIDAADADPDRIRRQLVERGLVIEEWGGEVIAVPISATQKEGIEDLLENILAVAEISELKANPDRPAVGVVIESKVDKNRGPIATVLIQTGTLRVGQIMTSGDSWGRVRALVDENGRRIMEAGPSTPTEVLGLGQLPKPGDKLLVVSSEKIAKELLRDRQRQLESESRTFSFNSLEEASNRISSGESVGLNLIVKTDVQGSVDAVRNILEKLGSESSRVNLIHAGTGTINESDVLLASTSGSIVIGFNTRIEPGARKIADTDRVDIRLYNIIYRLTEDVQRAMEGLLKPVIKEVVEGYCEVRAIFSVGRRTKIAGSYVTTGNVSRNATARVLRGEDIIFSGSISSLRHFKDDVGQVAAGSECGIGVDGFNDFEIGDTIEAVRIG